MVLHLVILMLSIICPPPVSSGKGKRKGAYLGNRRDDKDIISKMLTQHKSRIVEASQNRRIIAAL